MPLHRLQHAEYAAIYTKYAYIYIYIYADNMHDNARYMHIISALICIKYA